MRIAILGGTGDLGEALALRWGHDAAHDVVIGSRDPDAAHAAADAYGEALDARGRSARLTGSENGMAAARADGVVLAVPPYHVADVVGAVGDRLDDGDVLVTPAAGLTHGADGAHHNPPAAGSVTALVADAAPEDVPVIGAFHSLAAGRLADLDADLGIDTLLVGDDGSAKRTVAGLAEDIDGLRAVDAGGLANAAEVEALTPLLVNVGARNGLDDPGVRFR